MAGVITPLVMTMGGQRLLAKIVVHDAEAMQDAGIYPGIWDRDSVDFNLQWLRGHYETLVTFFSAG